MVALIDHRGKTPKKLGTDWVDDGVRVLSALHVKGGRLQAEPQRFIPRDVYDRWMPEKLQVGDVLLTSEAPLGEVAYLSESVEACLGQRLFGLRPKPEVLDSRYLFYLLQHSSLRSQLLQRSSGTTVAGIRQAELVRVALELPHLDHQQRVADALGSFDDLIENNRRRIEILEEMARLLYREWFVHFRFPGHEDVELVDSELGPIPEGWEALRLSDLVTTQYGYTESSQADPVGPRYLRGMDMNKTSYIDWSTVPYCPIDDEVVEKYRVAQGDVFVIRMADPGKVSICEQEVDAVFASYLVRIRPSTDDLTSYYLYFTLSDDRYQGWVTGASTGSTRKSVSAKVMTEPRIVVPPRSVQGDFVGTVEPIRELLTNLLKQNSVLREARDLLLPRLVSGELDVTELDLHGVLA